MWCVMTKIADNSILALGLILVVFGVYRWHMEKDMPRETRVTGGIGRQLIWDYVTTNRYAVWQTTSNGPFVKNHFGVWSVECYTGVTIYRTQTYW